MLALGFSTTTPRAAVGAGAFAAGAAAGAAPFFLADFEPSGDIVVLLNDAFAEARQHLAHGPIGRGLQDFDPSQILAAAEHFQRVADAEPVVGAQRDFDHVVAVDRQHLAAHLRR